LEGFVCSVTEGFHPLNPKPAFSFDLWRAQTHKAILPLCEKKAQEKKMPVGNFAAVANAEPERLSRRQGAMRPLTGAASLPVPAF